MQINHLINGKSVSSTNYFETINPATQGVLAEVASGDDGDELWLRAVVGDPSGSHTIRLSATGLPSATNGGFRRRPHHVQRLTIKF